MLLANRVIPCTVQGMAQTPQPKGRAMRNICRDYVCWVDYLADRTYRLYVKVPGAYRLYLWAERHQ